MSTMNVVSWHPFVTSLRIYNIAVRLAREIRKVGGKIFWTCVAHRESQRGQVTFVPTKGSWSTCLAGVLLFSASSGWACNKW